MPENLEFTLDKFTFRVALDRFYSSEGIWAKPEAGGVRIGLSDFLQQRSGDVAFAEVQPAGTALKVGDEVAVIETIKVNISLALRFQAKSSKSTRQWKRLPKRSTRIPTGPAGWL